MTETKPKRKARNKKAIRQLETELQEIEDAFGWYGIGVSSPEPNAASPIAATAVPISSGSNEEREIPVPLDENLDRDRAVAEEIRTVDGQQEGQEEDEGEDQDGDYGDDQSDVDAWDIQFAVDQAVSSMLKSKVIPELKDAKKAPNLSELFAILFGEDHEFTKQAEYFEELINGYADAETISRDDLVEAHGVLLGILEQLQSRKRVLKT